MICKLHLQSISRSIMELIPMIKHQHMYSALKEQYLTKVNRHSSSSNKLKKIIVWVQQRQHATQWVTHKDQVTVLENPRNTNTEIISVCQSNIRISNYSTLTDALNINHHGKREQSISMNRQDEQSTLTMYDPQLHHSTYSALHRALG